eukprot:4616811-Prymnesium_polylepis.1
MHGQRASKSVGICVRAAVVAARETRGGWGSKAKALQQIGSSAPHAGSRAASVAPSRPPRRSPPLGAATRALPPVRQTSKTAGHQVGT